jgi:ATP-dependent DNA helicase RecQ
LSDKARNILTQYWGFSSFRPLQEEIIDAVLKQEDVLALLPTGGGKSVCFQIPALLQEGLCLVITPLIALMKDQVNSLKKRGIAAGSVHTGMHRDEIESVYSNCLTGKIKFLYISPERLNNDAFLFVITRLKVNLITVDEAHCISQWGYDFRPPYLHIAKIRELLTEAPVLALTATATPNVANDIMDKLNFKKANIYKASFERKNISYNVFKENDKIGRLIRLLQNETGSAIVYVRNRRKTRELAEILSKNNIKAIFYHAGLDAHTRDKKQKEWTKGTTRVIVATNAFGMGIDKADVRQVIHYDLPDCIESYFQEAGRAGRDTKTAVASLLVSNTDIANAKKRMNESFPSMKTIRNVYNALGNYLQIPEGSGKDTGYDFGIADFSKQYSFNILEVYSSIRFLEREGFIFYIESAGKFSKLFIPVNKETLYRYMVEHPESDQLLKEVLRSYGGVFTDYISINETQLAKRAGMKRDEVVKKLNYLSKSTLLKYVPIRTKPQLVYVLERLSLKNIQLSKENYKNQKAAAEIRLQSLLDFLSNSIQCRSQQLLHYFGQNKVKRCGICDVCLEKNKVELNEIEFSSIETAIETNLKSGPKHLYNLVSEISGFNEDKIISVIRWLLDNGKLIRQKDESLKWHNQLDLSFE